MTSREKCKTNYAMVMLLTAIGCIAERSFDYSANFSSENIYQIRLHLLLGGVYELPDIRHEVCCRHATLTICLHGEICGLAVNAGAGSEAIF